jgi:hypothetical protein
VIDDEPADSWEAAKMLEGRSVESADLDERWANLTLKLDDGSLVYVDGLRTGDLEIAYLSPHEVFEIDRHVMEEQIVDETIKRLRREGHLPALFDDRLKWTELAAVAGREPSGVWLTHETAIGLESGVLRAYCLSDGRRLVDQGDVCEIFGVVGASDIDDERIGKAITRALSRH